MVCCAICYTAPPRHLLTILAFLGLTLAFCIRQVVPITIQEMTLPTSAQEPRLVRDYSPKHKWSETQQALILMGFYIGYSMTHFFVGPVIRKMGARGPIITGMTIAAVMTGLIPLVAGIHWTAPMGIRILTGVGQSVLLPGISSLLTFWVPLESRSVVAAIIYAGVPMGTFLGIYLSAIVVVYWENWHYAYYMWSAFTVLWLLFFVIYIYSYPKTHPRIASQGSSYQRADFIRNEDIAQKVEKLTYCCQTAATFGHTYILFTLDTYLPKYMNQVLGFELEDYSVYSSTPFAMMYLCGIISRLCFNWMVTKRNASADFLRLIYCSICNLLSAIILVLAFNYSWVDYITLTMIHLATSLGGLFYGGLNMLDLSMRHTATAMSIVNGLATTSGVAAITAISLVVKTGMREEWEIVAYVMLAVEVIAWILDCMFTMTKLCLMPTIPDKHWYQNVPQSEHEHWLAALRTTRETLKSKQRGEMAVEEHTQSVSDLPSSSQ